MNRWFQFRESSMNPTVFRNKWISERVCHCDRRKKLAFLPCLTRCDTQRSQNKDANEIADHFIRDLTKFQMLIRILLDNVLINSKQEKRANRIVKAEHWNVTIRPITEVTVEGHFYTLNMHSTPFCCVFAQGRSVQHWLIWSDHIFLLSVEYKAEWRYITWNG